MRTSMIRPCMLVICVALAASGAEPVSFNRDIRPIFSDTCWHCHGPGTQKAGMRLDVRGLATKPAKSGATPIVAGKPDESEVMKRLLATDEDDAMPPSASDKHLTNAQRELIGRWIAEGAVYEPHWAYAPVRRPPVPAGAINPVDAFVQARLTAEGLAPAPEADRATLLRRVSLDLTGLPPEPVEIDAFAADARADAYERAVDRLMSGPRYAEKQTVHWLDLVRYADTSGFHGDQDVQVWPYRDWVLNAFASNLAFDRFTRDQLAGDLVPQATREQRVATAFNRLNRKTAEGGVQDREYLAKYAADRVRTVGMAWLGSTIGCAECHDHKFDPFSTRDFYAMSAFFSDVEERGFYGGGFEHGDWGPSLQLPDPEQERAIAALESGLAGARHELDVASIAPESQAAWERRMLELEADKRLRWFEQEPISASSTGGATMTIAGARVSAGGINPDSDVYTVTLAPGVGDWESLRIRVETDESFPGNRFARGWRSFVLSGLECELVPGAGQNAVPIAFSSLIDPGASDRFPAWAALDDDPSSGWAMEFGHSSEHRLVLHLAARLTTTADSALVLRLRFESPIRRAAFARFAIALSPVPGATRSDHGLDDEESTALHVAGSQRTASQAALVRNAHRRGAAELSALRARVMRLAGGLALARGRVASVLVTKATTPRPVRVLPRGNWMDESGEVVEPATPAFLTHPSGTAPRRLTRLDLAEWLTAPDQPLTARVFANRIWAQFFGTGLSRVLDDVGS